MIIMIRKKLLERCDRVRLLSIRYWKWRRKWLLKIMC